MSEMKTNAGYLLQLCGGCLAAYAFFCLPYLVIHTSFATAAQLGIGNLAYSSSDPFNTTYNALTGNPLYWTLLLLAAGIAIVAGIQASRSTKDMVSSTVARVLCIPTGVILVILLWSHAVASIQGNEMAIDYASGFWVYVAGLLLIMAGGVVAARLE